MESCGEIIFDCTKKMSGTLVDIFSYQEIWQFAVGVLNTPIKGLVREGDYWALYTGQ